MKKIYLLLSLLLIVQVEAKILITPQESMKNSFPDAISVVKKNILLTKEEAKSITKDAKVKIKSKIFRVFKALKGESILGYGVLINKRVRSKNAVILYMIESNGVLKSIEIVAFNEPLEYLPSSKWNAEFKGLDTALRPRLGKEIATITGATLSARSVTDGARLAFALYTKVLKEK